MKIIFEKTIVIYLKYFFKIFIRLLVKFGKNVEFYVFLIH